MKTRNQSYLVAVAIAAVVGVSGLMGNIGHFAFASRVATTNQTAGNQTGANMTTTAGGGEDQVKARMHLGEAMEALATGDAAGAKMHMEEADKVLQEGNAKMHLGEAIKALQAGNTTGASIHATAAAAALHMV
jgi:cellobiose-specific phosphotransferase system component IIA